MDNISSILALCAKQNVSLSLNEGTIDVSFDDMPTDELLSLLRENKPALITFLQEQQFENESKKSIPCLYKQQAPLSFVQERLWLLQQANPTSAQYNMPSAFFVTGEFNVAVAEKAMHVLIERHEILRTNYHQSLDNEVSPYNLVQKVNQDFKFSIYREDFRCEVGCDNTEQIMERIRYHNCKPFDLSKDLMIRAVLIALDPVQDAADAILLFNMHHIASDGWSMELLVKEFMAIYSGLEQGVNPALDALDIQYSDYAVWQREQGQSQQQASLDYWQKHLQGAPETHNLPLDYSGISHNRGTADLLEASLSKEEVEKLQSLAQKHNMTLFMVLHAAMALTLSCHSNAHDIVIGTPIANRQRPELQGMIGCFVNTLVLRTNTDFADLDSYLEHVRNIHIQAQKHQDVPFEEVLRCANIKRSREHSPLVQVLINMEFDTQTEIQLGQATLRKVADTDKDTLKFDLVLKCKPTESGLSIRWLYNQGMFKSSRFEQINGHFVNLLRSFTQQKQALTSASMLSSEEKCLIEQNANGELVDYPKNELINTLFEKQACDFPDQIALMFESESMTYQQLDSKANQLAHWLRAEGVKSGCLVGVHLNRSLALPVALLAIMKAGGAFVPIAPEYPDSRVEQILDDTQLQVIITESAHGDSLKYNSITRIDTDAAVFEQKLQHYPATLPEVIEPHDSSSLVYVMYTSGSTGKPKGVMIEHRSLQCRLYWMQCEFQMTHSDRLLQKTPITFDPSMCELFWTLCYGGTLVLAKPQGHRDPVYLSELMAEQNITITHFVPSMLNAFLENQFACLAKSVRLLISSGEALSESTVQRVFVQNATMRFVNLYGPTEATIDVAWYECHPESTGIIPIGKPVYNTELLILDKHLSLCPVGVIGELHIAGELLARGYWKNTALTDAAFIAHPYQAEKKLYKTGDLARVDNNGNIEYLGRIDQQVKIRGNRIELSEVELCIGQIPTIESNVVKVFNHNGNTELAAFIKTSQPAELADLKRSVMGHLKQKLPGYMIPNHITQVAQWPLTTSGKVDRKQLHVDTQQRTSEAVEQPTSTLEKVLHDIWTKELSVEQMSVNDDFFESGGHSILGMRIINELQQHLNQVIHITAIFEAPTIRTMAEWLQEKYANALVKQGWLEVDDSDTQPDETELTASDFEQFSSLLPSVEHKGVAQQKIDEKVVFILAPPRSGTTLLRVMLSGHAMLFSPPELELLWFETLGQRAEYFTGRQSFWREGTLEALKNLKQIDGFNAEQLLTQYEQDDISISAFYRNLIDLSDGRILVDKTPTYAYRLSSLEMAEKIFPNAHYIHLVRHPAGMINSFEKASLDQILYLNKHDYSSAKLAELVWSESQKNINQFLANVPSQRQLQVHFEDLVSESDSVMRTICEFLEIEFAAEVLDPYANLDSSMTQGNHAGSRMLGDVKFHQHSKIEQSVATQWRQSMSNEQLSGLTQSVAGRLDIPDFNETLTKYMDGHTSRPEQLPLSYSQQRLLLIDRVQNGSAEYNMPVAFDVDGQFNLEVAQKAFNALIARHEILRTQYRYDGKSYYQEIVSNPNFEMDVVDLSVDEQVVQIEKINQIKEQFNSYAFDLTNELILRACFIRTEGAHTSCSGVLLLNIHHIASDGFSMGIFAKEFVQCYRDLYNGDEVSLAPLQVQYADYANWQRIWLRGDTLNKQMTYWKNQLQDLPAVHSLPLDKPRREVKAARSRVYRTKFDKNQTNILLEFCQSRGATLFMGLHSLFSVLLSRYSNETDIVIGTPVANREQHEITNNIGFFVNMLVLRSDLSERPSFSELLHQSKQTLTKGYSHQQVPFEQLVEALQPERSVLHTPLFQVALVLQPNDESVFELPQATLSARQNDERFGKYDLVLNVGESEQGLTLGWEYCTALFNEDTIATMAEHFHNLLQAMLNKPDVSVFALPMLSESEVSLQQTQWNETKFDYDKSKCVHQLFEHQVKLTPTQVAVEFANESLTYAQLNSKANRLANLLIESGVKPNSKVGIYLERSTEMLIAVMATMKAGAAYVPLEPSYPRKRIEVMLEDAQIKIALTNATLVDSFPSSAVQVLTLNNAVTDERWLADYSDDNLSTEVAKVSAQNLAYILYTSGSTGRPKGVMVSHQSVVNYLTHAKAHYLNDTLVGAVVSSPLAFDATLTTLLTPLTAGKVVRILAAGDGELDCLAAQLQDTQDWLFKITPAHLEALSQMLSNAGENTAQHHIVVGGEQLSYALLAQVTERLLPNCTFTNEYGPTETVVGCSTYTIAPQSAEQKLPRSGAVPIGKPICNTRLYVLSPDMQAQPVNSIGELYIGGDGVTLGYLNRLEQTQHSFITHPAVQGERLYRTGDLVRWGSDGELMFVGRMDNQVKIRGFRIELDEIEHALLQHPGVSNAVVMVQQEDTACLAAYIVVDTQAELTQIQAELANTLPKHFIPDLWVSLDAMPLTPNGKIDKKALPKAQGTSAQEYIAPQTQAEQDVCRLCAELLNIERAGCGDNFFALGGHSLLAVRMMSELQNKGYKLDALMIFQSINLGSLAAQLTRDTQDAEFVVPENRIVAGSEQITPQMLPLINLSQAEIDKIAATVPGGAPNIRDIYPLGPLQEGILFHHLLDPAHDVYVLSSLFAMDSKEEVESLLAKLTFIVARHDVLRTAIVWEGLSQAVQVVCDSVTVPVQWEAIEDDVIAHMQQKQGHSQMDLTRAPLLAVHIGFNAAQSEFVVMVKFHHLISDHVGLEIIAQELAYFERGEQDKLAAPVPYRNFIAHTQARQAEQDSEGYFRAQLGDIDSPTTPFNLLDIQGDGRNIDAQRVKVPAALSAGLRKAAVNLKLSPAVLFHAAWGIVVGRCSQQEDVVFGTVLSGRLQGTAQAASMMGVFINTLPLRISLGKCEVSELIAQVNTRLQGLLEYEQTPLSEAQRCSGVDAQMPLFSAVLNYRHTQVEAVETGSGPRVIDNYERTNYPFNVSVEDLGQAHCFGLDIQVDSSVGAERVAGYFLTMLSSLLAALEAGGSQAVSQLEMLTDEERNRQLSTWNDTARPYPATDSLVSLFEAQADVRGEAVAACQGEASISYAELDKRANQVARYLRSEGAAKGSLIGLCFERHIDMLVGMLGILKAGCAYVPLDPAYPQARLKFMCEDANLKFVLTERAIERRNLLPQGTLCVLDDATVIEHIARQSGSSLDVGVSFDDLAYVIYTSGSTGQPKGVMITHQNAVAMLSWAEQFYTPAQRAHVLASTSVCFDLSIFEIFLPLTGGTTVVLVQDVLALLQQQVPHNTLLNTVPSAVETLLDTELDLSVFESINLAGEPLKQKTVDMLYQRGVKNVYDLYGPSEDTTYSTVKRRQLNGLATIGKPISNTQAYVLSQDNMLCPVGVAGELYLGGAGVAKGYWNRQDLTQARFVSNPFGDGVLYKTGDLVKWTAEGELKFLGRMDNQVKIRGFRIELGEIEHALLQHPDISHAVVMVQQEDAACLVAYIVVDTQAELTQIQAELANTLPKHFIPELWVSLDAMPLTPNGKIDKKALPKAQGTSAQEYIAPQTQAEQDVCRLCVELLNVERAGCGDNFFALGGHSLLAVRLMSGLQCMGYQVDAAMILQSGNLGALAAQLTRDTQDAAFVVPENRIVAGSEQITPQMLPLINLSQAEIDKIVATVPGGAPNIRDIYPLGPLQEGILFHHLLDPAHDVYVLSSLFTMDSKEAVESLLDMLTFIVARHDVLRTAIVWEGLSQAVQVVCDSVTVPVQWEAIEGDVIAHMQQKQGHSQMDLTRAPLLAVHIGFNAAQSEFVVMVKFHHLISDHVGLEIIAQELAYFERGEQDKLAAPVPYRNFIAHTQARQAEQDSEGYFRAQLGDIDSPTVPFNLLDIQGDGRNIDAQRVKVPAALSAGLRKAAVNLKLSPAVLFHAAWGIVVGRCSQQEDVVFGTVLSGRLQGTAQAASMMGVFINTLPLRMSLGKCEVSELIAQVNTRLQDLLEYEQTPLSEAQRCSGVDAQMPLFSAVLNYRHTQVGEVTSESGPRFISSYERANYPFDVSVDDLGQAHGFELDIQVDSSVGAERVGGYFLTMLSSLLAALEAGGSQAVSQLEMLTEEERNRQLSTWNDTARPYPATDSLVSLFEAQADVRGEAVAACQGEASISYAELDKRANQVARYLRSEGAAKGSLIGLCFERHIDMLVGMLGILKAGCAYVPLDPTYPASRRDYMMADTGMSQVITQLGLAGLFADLDVTRIVLDDETTARRIASLDMARLDDKPSSDALAYIIYTSGSTGQPKGVMVEHKGVVNLVLALHEKYALTAQDRILQFASVSFDMSVEEIFTSLCHGNTLVLRTDECMASANAFWRYCESMAVSVFNLPPVFFHELLSDDVSPMASSLRLVSVGGDKLPEQDIVSWYQRAPDSILMTAYGPTEYSVNISVAQLKAEASFQIGKPLANTAVYVLDEQLNTLPTGAVGELCVSGVGLARGYLNKPEQTAQQFVPNPYYEQGAVQHGAVLYRTGDLVRWLDNGNLDYVGRQDQQVKIRGFRVEPGEIESLLNQSPLLSAALVVVNKAQRHEAKLVAYVIAASAELEADLVTELQQYLAERLPSYMLPSAIVSMTEFPLNSNGKIDRKALPAPEFTAVQSQAGRNGTERTLVQIWSAILERDGVGINDNFFELGGHSLTAMKLVSEIKKQFNIDVPLKVIFEKASIVAFADWLNEHQPQSHIPVLRAAAHKEEHIPLSYAQQRLWMLAHIEGDSSHYNMPMALEIKGPLCEAAVASAITQIVQRHEVLRTSIQTTPEGEPYQMISEVEAVDLPLIDLSASANTLEQAQQLQAYLTNETKSPFALDSDLMLRAQLFRLGNEHYVLAATMHHIASDGWSMDILIKEFVAFYKAYNQSTAPSLQPLELQYADYACWQRNWLYGDVLDAQLDYWQQQLAGIPQVHSLPTDKPRPKVQTFVGARHRSFVAKEAYQQLELLCQRHEATLFMGIQTAFSVLLSQYSNSKDVVIGTPTANRDQSGIADMIGFFVNMLVLRTYLTGQPSFNDLLAQSKKVLLEAYTHQHVPFEQLVDKLQPKRSLSFSPLFQILLVMQNDNVDELVVPGLDIKPITSGAQVSKYDITLSVSESDAGLYVEWEYNTDLFDEQTIVTLDLHFQRVIESVTQHPEENIFTATSWLQDALPTSVVSHLALNDESEQTAYEPPHGETEQQLVRICAELLGVEEFEISMLANFFELGGNSLLFIRLLTKVNKVFGIKLKVQDVFDLNNLREFASFITINCQAMQAKTEMSEDEEEEVI